MSIELDFVFVWVEIDLISFGVSNLTLFQCRDRNRLGFGVRVENDLVLVFRSEINLLLVLGSKLTRFLCGDWD